MNSPMKLAFLIFLATVHAKLPNDQPATNLLMTTLLPSSSQASSSPTSTSSTTTTTASTTTSTSTSTTTTGLPVASSQVTSPGNTCFYAEPELCAVKTTDCECNAHPLHPNSLVCCNVTDINRAIGCAPSPVSSKTGGSDNGASWLNLHIRNAMIDDLNISVSNRYFKRLHSLVITDGYIKKISDQFTRFSSPTCLNVSNNNISEIESRALKELRNLQVLDISHNNLSTIPNINSLPSNLTLDIRGNEAMLCKSVLESIERGGFKFVEPNSTFCLTNRTFNWFNSTDSIPLRQLESMKQLQSECPVIPGHGNCTCEVERLNYEQQLEPLVIFTVKVDCSNLGLIELPEKLPTNTLTLNVSNNNITSLAPLNQNPTYHQLVRLYADDNQIVSLLDLEGTQFIEKFATLFLRRNKLKSLPIYLLTNWLDKNPNGRQLYLEGNKLTCDCNSAKVLRIWLLARNEHIYDGDRILCDNMPQKIVDLSDMKLCQSHHDWTDYIYYLIAAEIILLIALIMKVSYDYWVFKTAGYLPWPASRMPKLPCDWLCES